VADFHQEALVLRGAEILLAQSDELVSVLGYIDVARQSKQVIQRQSAIHPMVEQCLAGKLMSSPKPPAAGARRARLYSSLPARHHNCRMQLPMDEAHQRQWGLIDATDMVLIVAQHIEAVRSSRLHGWWWSGASPARFNKRSFEYGTRWVKGLVQIRFYHSFGQYSKCFCGSDVGWAHPCACRVDGEAVMMGLAWKSLESRIRRDPDFRRQMIETYRKAFRDNPHLGEEFDVFLMKLGIQAEVRSQDESWGAFRVCGEGVMPDPGDDETPPRRPSPRRKTIQVAPGTFAFVQRITRA
jgi:hypothetical protein